jgi:hypothetical protein
LPVSLWGKALALRAEHFFATSAVRADALVMDPSARQITAPSNGNIFRVAIMVDLLASFI